MKKLPKDLFPQDLKQAATAIFGKPVVAAILLRQLPPAETDPVGLPTDYIPVTTLLHPGELAKLDSYRLAKRRAEFLTGRVCAKMALQRFWTTDGPGHLPPLERVEVTGAANGRPMIQGDGLQGWPAPEISITHGGEYAAAIVAQRPCGIDLQEQKDNLSRVREKYCSPAELRVLTELFPETPPLSRLCLLWTAKEAAKKALSSVQMPGFLELELTSPATRLHSCHALVLAVQVKGNAKMPDSVTVLVTALDNYGLAICILTKEQHHA
jgi:4'-phosphopantetheinyl transferase EntD